MPRFVLYPARLRDGKLVALKDEEPLELGWKELRDRFAPSRSRQGLLVLRNLRQGSFIGTRKRGEQISNFMLEAAGKSSDISKQLSKDPYLAESIVEVFYVELAEWDVALAEAG